jgi:DNA-binding protein H-NS
MSKDLTQMSYAELLEVQKTAEKLIAEQRENTILEVVSNIRREAEANSLEIEEIVARLSGGSGKIATKSAPKYAHPENESVSWTGRGRAPAWVLEYVGVPKLNKEDPAQVAKLDELLIDK